MIIPQSPSLKHERNPSPPGKLDSLQERGKLELNKLKKLSGWAKNRNSPYMLDYLKETY